jgi:predicted butyrate kinase (DUF1464 family)
VCRSVAALRAVTPFEQVIVSGRLLEEEPGIASRVCADLSVSVAVGRIGSLAGVWVKHAAQGSAILADGVAGGRFAPLVEQLDLRGAGGTVLDWLHHPRAAECRSWFLT